MAIQRTKPRRSRRGASALGAVFALGSGLLAQGAAQQLPFYDLAETHWAYGSVSELAELGILTGYPDGRFDGTRATTRYEVAVVAARLLAHMDAVGSAAAEGPDATERTAAPGGAAALEHTRRLEARVVALEAALNAQDTSSSVSAEVEDSAVALTPEARADVTDATSITLDQGQELVEIRFSERPEHPFYVGISPGVVSTAGDVYLSVQTGYDALIGPVGPAARLTFNGGNRELRVGVDALAKADLLVDTLKLYGGLGVGGTVRPGGGSFLLEAPFGGEYLITPRVGLFLQLTTSYGFAPLNEVDAELSTGVNVRF
jgi:hypothetical protein